MTATQLVVSLPGTELHDLLVRDGLPEGVTLIRWDLDGPAPTDHIDIVVPPYMTSVTRLAHLEGVTTRLVQKQSIGYDGAADYLPPGNTLANAASVHESATAELTLALILAMQRGLPDFIRGAKRGAWDQTQRDGLADHRVIIVGYGGVGKAIEARLRPFEVSITRVAHSARETPAGRIHAVEDLPALLPDADIVVLALPLTPQSEGLVDDTFLGLMPKKALLVNIARGPIVDTAALVRHLDSGHIRAALDVTDPEPLPAGHPLWETPNTLITPHVGGRTAAMMPRFVALLQEQIRRLQSGQEPINVVISGSSGKR
ncbi:2-hydroxyacid dehydrogenase [Lysinibacter sp. HNR]|uniref:2-hydroxyacid dehydrogenase n=1 Tax=Lysinibacter sp. HNR TaxID=3031408 RepID=UPI0024359282|nr:2-hydroxyacid dehydrogenase [Lysinibacter sp. HNR]WGD37169.1 2-hydroxyacid dehydrogenase [Lysinibacter sp. HNR]